MHEALAKAQQRRQQQHCDDDERWHFGLEIDATMSGVQSLSHLPVGSQMKAIYSMSATFFSLHPIFFML